MSGWSLQNPASPSRASTTRYRAACATRVTPSRGSFPETWLLHRIPSIPSVTVGSLPLILEFGKRLDGLPKPL
jgi:hypothetical protein